MSSTSKLLQRADSNANSGGDYGFAWCPHGSYARDLEHFVKLLDFTPLESIIAATAGIAKLFMQEHELGKILPGYYADCILVDGDPLENIAVLQDHDKLNVIMINGKIHKSSDADFCTASTTAQSVSKKSSYKFATFEDELGRSRVGDLDLKTSIVHPLAMPSGAALSSLQEVIELQTEVARTGESFPLSSVKLLPPVADRDIICVGNNYRQHVEEYQNSGYASQMNQQTGK